MRINSALWYDDRAAPSDPIPIVAFRRLFLLFSYCFGLPSLLLLLLLLLAVILTS